MTHRISPLSLLFALGVGLLMVFSVSSAAALPLRIVDCNGNTKALREVQPAGETGVKVSVVSGPGPVADGVGVTLTNGEGEVLRAVATDGVADFGSVGPGNWVLGSDQGGLFFNSISFGNTFVPPWWDITSISVLKEVAVVVGVIATGVAVVAVANEINDSGKSSSGNNSGGGGSGGSGPVCPSCNPDAEAPSIPAF